MGFTTFILRTCRDIVANCVLTLAPPAVTTALYLVIFGNFAGERIGPIDGIPYQHFLAPGLILLPVVTASYGQAGLSFVVARLDRTLDEHLMSPQPPWMIAVSISVDRDLLDMCDVTGIPIIRPGDYWRRATGAR